jgi:hypothetical protein
MTDAIIIGLLGCAVVGMFWMFRRLDSRMRIALPGSPAAAIAQQRDLLWHSQLIPPEATHIAWIMLGRSDYGTVHTLALQDIHSVRQDILEASSPMGPIITKSIELEMDMMGRGCIAASEIMYAIARIDRDGNERWLGRNGTWVSRWSPDADVQDIFGDQRSVTL